MNRRKYLSAVGTAGVGAVAIWFVYQIDQGNIDIGDEAELSETVRRQAETFEFEATEGTEIGITLEERDEGRRRGSMALTAPDGSRPISTRVGPSGRRRQTHVADVGGTYHLNVDPAGGRYRVIVALSEPDEDD